MCNLSFHQNMHPRFQAENLEQNKTIYFQIGKLAEKHGCSPAQLALGWILHQGDVVIHCSWKFANTPEKESELA